MANVHVVSGFLPDYCWKRFHPLPSLNPPVPIFVDRQTDRHRSTLKPDRLRWWEQYVHYSSCVPFFVWMICSVRTTQDVAAPFGALKVQTHVLCAVFCFVLCVEKLLFA